MSSPSRLARTGAAYAPVDALWVLYSACMLQRLIHECVGCRVAQAVAVQRMLEEHTYFVALYWLWVQPDVSGVFVPRMMDTFGLPWPLRPIVQRSVKKEMCRNLHGQVCTRAPAFPGDGLHSGIRECV